MVDEKVKLSKANVLLIIVAGLASYMDAALLVSLGVALPIWTKYLALNSWMVGLLSTMLTVAVAIGSFVGGWLSDKFGRVAVFNADIFFVAIGSFIIAIAQNTTILIIGVVIAGLPLVLIYQRHWRLFRNGCLVKFMFGQFLQLRFFGRWAFCCHSLLVL